MLVIRGYQHRLDDQREMQAYFISALINSSRTRKDKKVKATDLFDRKKRERELEDRKNAGNVASIEAKRREVMREIKQDGVPILPKTPS